MMQDYEKLGQFYLGRAYDPALGQTTPVPLLYDSRDLVTHAVCVGMTGSGKTGLGITLLEEAALDRVPAIVIDPKGDLTNLLLTFPELRPGDFVPWVNEEDARRKGLSREAYGAEQARAWREGLAAWDQDGDRIRRLREAAEFRLYTPGSDAGTPVSILESFAAPAPALLEERDLLRERVAATATSLLALLGIEADPIRSREHILVASILDHAWRAGRGLDLAGLVAAVQAPPMARVGVLDLETFYPSRERFELAMTLNNLLAAPGFDVWMRGEPLDVDRLLHGPDGRPRVSIFSLSHLGDAERMFFVSLLLNQTIGWMRAQPGTSSLRALLYMDEIFGFFPPVAAPPSKTPLLTLLKQARAFGLGVVLATQNPVDLDYKGLSNTGTWFLGRLQTERDKRRVLDGLEGVASASGGGFDRAALDALLSGLKSRVFLLHNVHDAAPQVFQTRWALSYLRGPLNRAEIRQLRERTSPSPDRPEPSSAAATLTPARMGAQASPVQTSVRPVLPPDVPQYFAPVPGGRAAAYEPRVVGAASVRYANAKLGLDVARTVTVTTPIRDGAFAVDWRDSRDAGFDAADLDPAAPEGAPSFSSLPPAAGQARNYEKWQKAFVAWIAAERTLDVFENAALGMVSKPGEDERAFRIRLQQAARERRDEAVEQLRGKQAPKVAALQERLRRAEQAVARETEQASQHKMQTALSFGATLLGAVLGRKTVSASTLGRATTTARGVGRTLRESQDVARAQDTVAAVKQQIEVLEERLRTDAAALEAGMNAALDVLAVRQVKAKRADVHVELVGLVWVPANTEPQA